MTEQCTSIIEIFEQEYKKLEDSKDISKDLSYIGKICDILGKQGLINIRIGSVISPKTTPLNMATKFGHTYIIKRLLKNGADINFKSEWGDTPMIIAARNLDMKVTKLLLKNNADINMQSDIIDCEFYYEGGETPIMEAIMEANEDKYNGHNTYLDYIQFLIDSGADINAKNGSGKSVVELAHMGSRTEIVELLLENKNLNTTDRERKIYNERVYPQPIICYQCQDTGRMYYYDGEWGPCPTCIL